MGHRAPVLFVVAAVIGGFAGGGSAAGSTATATTVRVSVANGGGQANGFSGEPSMSADGRYVAFASDATNLVPGDTNRRADVFVRDRLLHRTTRVSVAGDGSQAKGASSIATISADGHSVLFLSDAANLVPGHTNHQTDVFVHNLVTGRTTRVNVASDGGQSVRPADGRSISGDGRYVVFNTSATDLVAGAPPDQQNVYLHDLRTGRTSLVSRGSAGRPTNDGSFDPLITADGRFVVFDTAATNVVPGVTSGRLEVFVRNLRAGRTRLASRNSAGAQANADCQPVSVSAQGRDVLFFTSATNLVRGARGGVYHLYVRDRPAGRTTPIDVAVGGGLADDATNEGRLSADGRFVVFSSLATDLVAGDTNDTMDVFVRDRSTGRTTRVNVTAGGLQAMGGESFDAAISTDGRRVAFSSAAANLVPNDTNAAVDVFVRDRG